MTVLLLLILILLVGLVAALFLLGFRMGSEHWEREALRVRLESAQAARSLHALTRTAFVAMAEEAERRRGGSS